MTTKDAQETILNMILRFTDPFSTPSSDVPQHEINALWKANEVLKQKYMEETRDE